MLAVKNGLALQITMRVRDVGIGGQNVLEQLCIGHGFRVADSDWISLRTESGRITA
jgi:hypothetical protein